MKNLFKAAFKIFLGIFLAILVRGNVSGQDPCLNSTAITCGQSVSGTLGTTGQWSSIYGGHWSCDGEERIYTFTASNTGQHTFIFTDNTGDPDYFILESCSNSANCIGYAVSGTVNVNLITGNTYYIVADNYSSSNIAAYTMNLSACPNQSITYTVTYNANSGTGTMIDANSSYNGGSSVTVLSNAFTPPANKVFSKWNTAADGSGTDYNPGETFTISTNVTLYAQWIDKSILLENCESFENNAILDSWATEGYGTWHIGAGARNGRGGTHNGNYNMEIDVNSWGAEESYFIGPIINLSNIESGNIAFWYINPVWGESYPDDIDEIGVVYRIDNGEWIELFNTTYAHEEWTSQTIAMPSQMFTNNVEIAFRMKAHYGYGVGLDDICLELHDVQDIMLPITLLEFSAEPRYDQQTGVHVLNLLTIRTGYEYNNCEFIVYRSEDAINWDYDIPVCKWDFGRDSAIYNEALDTVLNYFTIEHPNGQTYHPLDTVPYPVTYYKLIQRDCNNTSTEYTSEIIVCIANQQKNLIEPYVICDNGPQVIGGSEVCEVFVQNILGQVVEEFQLQPYQQREVLAEIQGMYLITFVYKYNREARKKTEKIICM